MHTSRWIVDKCFSGDLVKGRTLILVTHNVAMAGPLARRVISISADGTISTQSTISEALNRDAVLRMEIANESAGLAMSGEIKDSTEVKEEAPVPNGKLIADEEVVLGHISFAAGASA